MKVMDLVQRDLRDPRLEGFHVTRVEMTRDLSRATLWFRATPGQASLEEVQSGVTSATGFLRREIARTVRLRAVPELVFRHDDVPDEGDRIEGLLAGLRAHGHAASPLPPSDDAE